MPLLASRWHCTVFGYKVTGRRRQAAYLSNDLGLDYVSATTIHPSDLIKSSMNVCYVMWINWDQKYESEGMWTNGYCCCAWRDLADQGCVIRGHCWRCLRCATLNFTLRQEDSYNQTQNTITDHSQCTLTAFLDTYVYVFNVRLTLVTLLIWLDLLFLKNLK